MRARKSSGCLIGSAITVLACFSLLSIGAQAQGLNAVYNSSGKAGSLAFVDATQYNTTGDICVAIQNILNQYQQGNVTGVVVDARGFPLAQGKLTYPCSANPWNLTTEPGSNIVFLPSGTITLSPGAKWVLADNTRIVGEGPYLTVIQAGSGFSGEIIDMGSQNTCPGDSKNGWDCQGVAIEHLGLDGGGNTSVSGIVNNFSQELSRAEDVALTNMSGVGLSLGFAASGPNILNAAGNSGPYSNISFSGSGTCVQALVGVRGIHGLTCNMTAAVSCGSGSPSAAVCLDSPNNNLEDVSITYVGQPIPLPDGILVGSQNSAQNSILININGSGLDNVVHISNQNNAGQGNCPVNACDLTLLGITSAGSSSAIQDDLTQTTVKDATVGMYVLGEQAVQTTGSPGYSRFTTSPNAQSWLVGAGQPSRACEPGTLYSCTGNSCSPGTIFGCVGGTTNWVQIK